MLTFAIIVGGLAIAAIVWPTKPSTRKNNLEKYDREWYDDMNGI